MVIMNDIQKYRIASAEWLRLKIHRISTSYIEVIARPKNQPFDVTHEWHPDTDANQQGMIEDELIKQGYFVDYFGGKNHYRYLIFKKIRNKGFIGVNNKSKPTAFRKAWMQFYETLEK